MHKGKCTVMRELESLAVPVTRPLRPPSLLLPRSPNRSGLAHILHEGLMLLIHLRYRPLQNEGHDCFTSSFSHCRYCTSLAVLVVFPPAFSFQLRMLLASLSIERFPDTPLFSLILRTASRKRGGSCPSSSPSSRSL